MSGGKVRYKYCIVPCCRSTSIKTPHKIFINIPKHSEIRKRWCDAMKRDSKNNVQLSETSVRYCCEDHFELEEDIENYMQWKIMGGNMRLKKGVVPRYFYCQHADTRPERAAAALSCHISILQRIHAVKEAHLSPSVLQHEKRRYIDAVGLQDASECVSK